MDAVAQAVWDRRTRRERRGAQQDRLPAVEFAERAERGPDDGQAPGRGLDHDQVVLRRGGREPLEVDPGRDDGVRAGEPRGSAVGDVLAGRHEPVDPREQTVALVLAGREAEPLRVDEGGDGRRPGLEEGHVGQPRHGRVEPVDDVEVPVPQRGRDVRADAHGDPDGGARRDGNGTRDCDDSFQLAGLEGATAREEFGRAGRGSEHHDGMAPPAQCVRDAGDVLVRVVRHRPRVRRHQADPKQHGPRL